MFLPLPSLPRQIPEAVRGMPRHTEEETALKCPDCPGVEMNLLKTRVQAGWLWNDPHEEWVCPRCRRKEPKNVSA